MYLERVRDFQWIVKVSKLCNLRCTYCYEYSELGDARRMSESQLTALFRNIAQFEVNPSARHQFIWHGGEPTLASPTYFARAIEVQREVFRDFGYAPKNKIQTNLFRLSEEWIDFLATGIFDAVGVSFDGIGDHRLTATQQLSTEKVIENMDRLLARGVRFGIICVVSKSNRFQLLDILHFCERIGVDCRFLPIYKDNFGGQNDPLACSAQEVLGIMRVVADEWLSSKSGIDVQPISSHLGKIARFLAGGAVASYEKARDANIFIVNTNGEVFGDADDYEPHFRYLNIFEDDLNTLSLSRGWIASVEASAARVQATCEGCSLRGLCNGFPAAEATRRELDHTAEGPNRCSLSRPLFAHLTEALAYLHVEGAGEQIDLTEYVE